jgi:hypothetical protein
MFLLRLQPLINSQPLLLKQVVVYLLDGVTPASLFHPITNQPISNVLKTDASGFISFKTVALNTLTFRTLVGLTLSPSAYTLYDTSNPLPAPTVETEIALPCAEMIVEGYAVKVNALNQLERCSAFNATHLNTLIGLAKQTGNIGNVIAVAEDEFMTNTAWAWQPDKPVFLGTDGTLTQSFIGVLFVQQVGVALTPTKIVIRISQPIRRA